jgi:lipoprotein-anchoring transpeptidase ErfK/SrfK
VSANRLLLIAGAAAIAAAPAAAQSFYVPGAGEPVAVAAAEPQAAPRRFQHGPNRFFVPLLQGFNHHLDGGAERHPGGAVATSPSGRQVYYIPAPREAEPPVTVARANPGDQQDFVEPYHRHRSAGAIDPRFRRQEVAYSGPHAPGTIVINSAERFLYLVQPGGRALRYGIGVGREGFGWRGTKTITRKQEWPDWTPPPQMLQRRPDLPRFMPGGPSNPMGARGLYLGSSLFRIHGTNEPHTIGQAVSSGCFRMMNDDVTDLYDRVRVGTRVVVM